jgi:hypothetical protein
MEEPPNGQRTSTTERGTHTGRPGGAQSFLRIPGFPLAKHAWFFSFYRIFFFASQSTLCHGPSSRPFFFASGMGRVTGFPPNFSGEYPGAQFPQGAPYESTVFFWLRRRRTTGTVKMQPLKGLGGSIRAIANLYLSVVPSEIYVCLSERLMPVLHLDIGVRALCFNGHFRARFAFLRFIKL